jgi:hypothetical protein
LNLHIHHHQTHIQFSPQPWLHHQAHHRAIKTTNPHQSISHCTHQATMLELLKKTTTFNYFNPTHNHNHSNTIPVHELPSHSSIITNLSPSSRPHHASVQFIKPKHKPVLPTSKQKSVNHHHYSISSTFTMPSAHPFPNCTTQNHHESKQYWPKKKRKKKEKGSQKEIGLSQEETHVSHPVSFSRRAICPFCREPSRKPSRKPSRELPHQLKTTVSSTEDPSPTLPVPVAAASPRGCTSSSAGESKPKRPVPS